MDQWWPVAVGGLLTGGVGLGVLQRLWPSRAERYSAEAAFRDDLMERIGQMTARVEGLERELDTTRTQYQTLLREYGALQEAHNQQSRELAELRAKWEGAYCSDCPLERRELGEAKRRR